MIDKKLQEGNNDLIIDAKLKASRVDYLLTHLLDFNNSPAFADKMDGIVIMNPTEHKLLQDSVINSINIANSIIERVLKDMNKKGNQENGQPTNTTTDLWWTNDCLPI